jgi:superfamily II DNA helicase RecQ
MLNHVFGHETFRDLQEQICNTVLARRDLVVITATGSGKSLTYQLPSLLCSGTTIVICPTRSLIHDQMLRLGKLDPREVRAVSLTGDLTKSEKEASYRALWKFQRGNNQNEQVHLCYVTPEAALHPRFTELLTRMYSRGKLDRIVIDEGHCMLESDHFFRLVFLVIFLLNIPR